MRVLQFILPLLLITSLSYGQLGKAADVLTEKRVKKVEKSLTFKTISFKHLTAECQRTTADQRKKLSKKKKVQDALLELEELLEKQFQTVQNEALAEKSDLDRSNQLLLVVKEGAPIVNRQKYAEEIQFYSKYLQLQNDVQAKKAYEENRKAEEKKVEDRFAAYDKRQAEKRKAEEEQRRLELEKKEAQRIADSIAWANKSPAERAFIMAKADYNAFDKMEHLGDGPEVGKVYQSLANALVLGTPVEDVRTYLDKLNGIAKKVGFTRKISLNNLKYFSTSTQKEGKAQIKKLTAEIESTTPSKANVNELRIKYQSIINHSRFYMVDYRFSSDIRYKAQEDLLMLELNYGNTDAACATLSRRPNYENYRTRQCKAWDEKNTAAKLAANAKKRKEEAAQWRKDNPGMIKMKSFLEMYSWEVEAYLGKPTKVEDEIASYVIDEGSYEIGYSNSKAVLIEFTPSKFIKFDKELLGPNGTLFDHKDNVTGACSGNTVIDSVGGLDSISFEWDCDLFTSITFFGENGKLFSVTAL